MRCGGQNIYAASFMAPPFYGIAATLVPRTASAVATNAFRTGLPPQIPVENGSWGGASYKTGLSRFLSPAAWVARILGRNRQDKIAPANILPEEPPSLNIPPRIAAIYDELGIQLSANWGAMANVSMFDIESRDYSHMGRLPTAKEMARSIIDARAKELNVPPSEVVVVVRGFGVNLVEVLLWLELGARVIAVETRASSGIGLLNAKDYKDKFPNLVIKYSGEEIPKGDIVVAIHPVGTTPFTLSKADLFEHLRENGILVVQSEFPEDYITPFIKYPSPYFQVAFHRPVDQYNYFLPSVMIMDLFGGTEFMVLKLFPKK